MNTKKLLIFTVVAILALGGAGFGVYSMKMNAPQFQGIGVDVRGQSDEVIESWETAFQKAVKREDLLKAVIEKSDYATKMGVSGDAAMEDLRKRATARYKSHKSMIEVGVTGQRKEIEALKAISTLVYQGAAEVVAKQDRRFAELIQSRKGR